MGYLIGKLIRTVVFGGIILICAVGMIGQWNTIYHVQNRGIKTEKKFASERLCKDYNEKSAIGKFFDISSRGWCH